MESILKAIASILESVFLFWKDLIDKTKKSKTKKGDSFSLPYSLRSLAKILSRY